MLTRMLRLFASLGTWPILAATIAAACDSPRPAVLFADYLPIQERSISSDVIYPGVREFDELLGHGWAQLAGDARPAQGRWIVDRWASLRFYVAVAGPLTLEIEAMPPSSLDRVQELSIAINDRKVGDLTMRPGWHGYGVSMPTDAVQIGWNRAELHFRHTTRADGESSDEPELAAAVRRLRLRTSLDRPVWDDRPTAIEVKNDPGGVARLEMPADSALELYVQLGPGARLVGSAESSLHASAQATDLRAAVDLLDEKGDSHTLVERAFTASAQRHDLEVDLARWSNSIVRLRLRVWGRSNGIIGWREVGVTALDPEARNRSKHPVAPPRSSRLGRPHVLIVLLDAARADAFDRNRRGLTPNVQALAADGTRFTQAWAPSAWTGESVPALLTGQHPDAMGSLTWGSQIPQAVPTLPELMATAGYSTLLWSQHNVWNNTSLQRGFTRVRIEDSSALANRDVLPGATDLAAGLQPTFTFVHLLPPHDPYSPPEPFLGSLTASYERSGTNMRPSPNTVRNPSHFESRLTRRDARYLRASYDENVRYADHLVGRIVATLRRAGRYETTLIVILGDHGEAFYEHGRILHRNRVYQEFLHVPLIVKWPAGIRGFEGVVDEPVSLIDLVPTLVDGVGVPAQGVAFPGRSLLPLALERARLNRTLYASTRPGAHREDQQIYALRSGVHKVIYNEASVETELYDLASDPGEQINLAVKQPFRARALVQELMLQRERNRTFLADVGGEQQAPIDADTLRALRALGYLQ